MSEEKKSAFKVSDRRKFTVEGDTRPDAAPEAPQQSSTATAPPPSAAPQDNPAAHQHAGLGADADIPVAEIRPEVTSPKTPSAEEATAGHDAYKESTASLDAELHAQYGPGVSKEMEATFGRILEPFYVTALMQLGVMGQQGEQRQVDIIGARQTIDTLTLLHEKMKGNLNAEEENFVQTMLYQLRLTYVDISSAVARAAQAGPPPGGGGSGFDTPLR
jgi:Domain of unknown function (DUF1844)